MIRGTRGSKRETITVPKVALFGNKNCPQTQKLRDILQDEGAQPLVFDIALGSESGPSITVAPQWLKWGGVDFADIAAIHIRCKSVNTPTSVPPLLDRASYLELRCRYLREQEYQSATNTFIDQLARRGKLVINPFTSAYLDHDAKAQLYERLRAQGFAVPRSLMTNDPERALSFVSEVGQAVAKPTICIGSVRAIQDRDLERLDELKTCPVLLQEFIVGDTLRVHIVGDTIVLALKVISDDSVDSRTAVKGVEYFKLPEGEEQLLVKANRALGLHYAAWDILATQDGRYVYLDCNPGPYIMWIGEDNVSIVFRELAKYMIAYARTGTVFEAAQVVRPWRPS